MCVGEIFVTDHVFCKKSASGGQSHWYCGRPLMWSKNRLGPSVEPCGTPGSTGVNTGFAPFTTTAYSLLEFMNEEAVAHLFKCFGEVHD